MGQFNLPSTGAGQQHSQPYGIGLGSADAIAASTGTAQPASQEQPQHDDSEELFGMSVCHVYVYVNVQPSCTGTTVTNAHVQVCTGALTLVPFHQQSNAILLSLRTQQSVLLQAES